MVGAAFAAVPLYFAVLPGDRLRRHDPGGDAPRPRLKGQRMLTVRFDANVAPGLAWSSSRKPTSITLRTGATATVFFKVRNRSAQRDRGARGLQCDARQVSGACFDKISCFCFTEQHLGPNESAELPVVFFLDPRLEQDDTMNEVDDDHAVLHAVRRAGCRPSRSPLRAAAGEREIAALAVANAA